jgi:iron complex outermembrane receptor protein
LLAGASSLSAATPDTELADLELEELLQVRIVTSVSKKPQEIGHAPAAVFVISQEDLRRSGVTNIADALRMVPGMEVAQINSHAWAVSTRGFNSYYATKLLVLVDGRSVYTPEFSGVYWETVDTLFEDIDRIEVIRGPGGTLWGANAVNGVVNIITKHTKDTQGGLLTAGAGNQERGSGSVRYGDKLSETTHYRVYAKTAKRDEFQTSVVPDGWQTNQAGFRVDGAPDKSNQWRVQSDIYRSEQDELDWKTFRSGEATVTGGNLLAAWERSYSEASDVKLRAYYDYYQRKLPVAEIANHTFDLEFQHRYQVNPRNELIWGLGYRHLYSDIPPAEMIQFDPAQRHDNLFNLFVQDDFKLIPDKLTLTVGGKIEHNDYTGWEIQPNLRGLWLFSEKRSLWAAVSRAVRAPNRVDHNVTLEMPVQPTQNPFYPVPLVVRGSGTKDFESETVVAYEIGLHNQPTPKFSWDMALFLNRYDKLTAGQRNVMPDLANGRILILQQGINGIKGETYGLELSASWKPLDWWGLHGAYTFLEMSLEDKYGIGVSVADFENRAAQHRVSLRSNMNLAANWELDAWLRYVTELPGDAASNSYVDAYASVDLRLGWRPRKDLELSLAGRNLFDKRHYEFIADTFNPLYGEVDRSFHLQARWQF